MNLDIKHTNNRPKEKGRKAFSFWCDRRDLLFAIAKEACLRFARRKRLPALPRRDKTPTPRCFCISIYFTFQRLPQFWQTATDRVMETTFVFLPKRTTSSFQTPNTIQAMISHHQPMKSQ